MNKYSLQRFWPFSNFQSIARMTRISKSSERAIKKHRWQNCHLCFPWYPGDLNKSIIWSIRTLRWSMITTRWLLSSNCSSSSCTSSSSWFSSCNGSCLSRSLLGNFPFSSRLLSRYFLSRYFLWSYFCGFSSLFRGCFSAGRSLTVAVSNDYCPLFCWDIRRFVAVNLRLFGRFFNVLN